MDKPKEELKPMTVKIVNISVIALPAALQGGIMITTFGLGSDELIYTFDGKRQIWIKQK